MLAGQPPGWWTSEMWCSMRRSPDQSGARREERTRQRAAAAAQPRPPTLFNEGAWLAERGIDALPAADLRAAGCGTSEVAAADPEL
jgi:hypothetical protein